MFTTRRRRLEWQIIAPGDRCRWPCLAPDAAAHAGCLVNSYAKKAYEKPKKMPAKWGMVKWNEIGGEEVVLSDQFDWHLVHFHDFQRPSLPFFRTICTGMCCSSFLAPQRVVRPAGPVPYAIPTRLWISHTGWETSNLKETGQMCWTIVGLPVDPCSPLVLH